MSGFHVLLADDCDSAATRAFRPGLLWIPAGVLACCAVWLLIEAKWPVIKPVAQMVWDDYLTDNTARETRRREAMLRRSEELWWTGPTFFEMTLAKRQKIHDETKGLDDEELIDYLDNNGYYHLLQKERIDMIGHHANLNERIRMLEAGSRADSPEGVELMERLRNARAERARAHRAAFAQGLHLAPPRTYHAFLEHHPGVETLDWETRMELYQKWQEGARR